MPNHFTFTPRDDPKDRIQVEVGDSEDITKAHPLLTIRRWDNEVYFSARLIHDEKTPAFTNGARPVWDGEKIGAKFYDVLEGEGGFEFEVILKEAPKKNEIKFNLKTKGLVFFYQPPLTEEIEIGGRVVSVTETDAFDIDGNSIYHRPENVIRSYAVYMSRKGHNAVGGKLYRSGKVGHIYRPRIVDAVGNETWGVMDINSPNGILTVTIPQEFLDTAVYPIRHAAGLNFGYETAGAASTSCAANTLIGEGGTPAATGTVDSVTSCVTTTTDRNIKGVILLTSTRAILTNGVSDVKATGTLTKEWVTATYTTKPTVTAATDYLAAWVNEGTVTQWYDTADSTYVSDTTNSYTTPAAPDAGDIKTTNSASTYATYTESTTAVNESESITITESDAAAVGVQANKSETITLTENKGAAIATTIAKSEAIAITESPLATVGAPQVNKSESITVSESVGVASPLQVNISDSVTISESIGTTTGAPQIAASESITLTDTPAVNINALISTSDNIALTESIAQEVGISQVDISENITATDTPIVLVLTQIEVNESITLSENVGAGVSDPQISAAENISVTDTPALDAQLQIDISDNISVSDTPIITISDLLVDLAENITASEAFSAQIGDLEINAVENITIGESITTSISDLLIEAADNITADESVEVVLGGIGELYATGQEDISLSESVGLEVSTSDVNVSDVIGATDTPLAEIEASNIAVAENITTSESYDIAIGDLAISVTDAISISEQVSAEIELSAAVFETVTISESASALFGCDVFVVENVTATESIDLTLPGAALIIAVSDNIAVSESWLARIIIPVALTLHARSTAWTVEDRSTALTIGDRAQTWTLDPRTGAWTLSDRSTAWTLEEDDR